MSETFSWWLILLVMGALAFPLCHALFRRLPDRGYALSKPFGMLLIGYLLWFLNSVHLLPNTNGGVVLVMLVIAGVAGTIAYRDREALRAWFDEHAWYVIGLEALFLLVFAVAVYLRSKVGYANITEQPMDLMYVNAATRASHFPPKDPWLSGHTVAYYYFGYLLVAMTARLAGVPTDVAYNLGLAMTAAMALIGAGGLVYNLVRMRESALEPPVTSGEPWWRRRPGWRAPLFGIAAGLMLVCMGNFAWVFAHLSSWGIGGQSFYDWIDIMGLRPDWPSHAWFPSESFGFFDASRIYPLNHMPDDSRVITEFPMFSFILGDLHPHVMALPIVLIAVGLALTLYRSVEPLDIAYWIERPLVLFASAMVIGGLAFLNTWDIATMAFVVVAAATLKNAIEILRARSTGVAAPEPMEFTQNVWTGVGVAAIALLIAFAAALSIDGLPGLALVAVLLAIALVFFARLYFGGWLSELGVQSLSFALPLLVLGVLLYLPFYVSFTSQANGIAAVVSNDGISVPATKPLHLLIFWGPLFALALPFVFARLLARGAGVTRRSWLVAAIPAAIVVVGWAVIFLFEQATDSDKLGPGAGNLFAQIADRGSGWLTATFLAAMLAAALIALWGEVRALSHPAKDDDRAEIEPVVFALGLIATALLLVLGTEFFFVGDVFNSRMNTVFKLYYQAWMLLAVGGGFALYYLCSRWNGTFALAQRYRIGWAALVVILVGGAATYPLSGSANRLHTFDGSLHASQWLSTDEQAAVSKLKSLAQGQDVVIAEGVGNDYDPVAARYSAATGLPTVMGWQGHENQWRGGTCESCDERRTDVDTLYQTTDPQVMADIVKKYGITFVIVGNFENQKYAGAGMDKFKSLPVVFQSGPVTIYGTQDLAGEVEARR